MVQVKTDIPEIKVYLMPDLLQFYCSKRFKQTTSLYKIQSDGNDITQINWMLDRYLVTKYGLRRGDEVIIYYPLKTQKSDVKNPSDS